MARKTGLSSLDARRYPRRECAHLGHGRHRRVAREGGQ